MLASQFGFGQRFRRGGSAFAIVMALLATEFRKQLFTIAEILTKKAGCGKIVGREIERKPPENWQIRAGIVVYVGSSWLKLLVSGLDWPPGVR